MKILKMKMEKKLKLLRMPKKNHILKKKTLRVIIKHNKLKKNINYLIQFMYHNFK